MSAPDGEGESLQHTISGFDILDEDECFHFQPRLMSELSSGVLHGYWDPEKYPEEFASLRAILHRNRDWYLQQSVMMDSIRAMRKDKPRAHWWWWIEDV